MLRRGLLFFVAAIATAAWCAAQNPNQCHGSYTLAMEEAKPNKLFLYFPTSKDTTFPFFGPIPAFDVAGLDSAMGTTAQLRDAIQQVVIADYCELNVQVLQTTTAPDSLPSPPARRSMVVVGSDTGDGAYGVANFDLGDAAAKNYGRVWGGEYKAEAGGSGGLLNGSNSTLQRWAIAIGGTAAHEAGHTYGLDHSDDASSLPGEDANTRHIMPAGYLVNMSQRVEYRRHFSDATFSILAANVGLAIQTVHNWDFTNPNAVEARQLQLEIYSPSASLTLAGFYDGQRTPWLDPSLVWKMDTATFKGTIYHRYTLTWSTGQSWANVEGAPLEPSGVVGPAKEFHIGASFAGVNVETTDPIIIHSVKLLDGSGNPLPLQPRMVGYDAGGLNAADAAMVLTLLNADAGAPLQVKDIQISQLPRVISIGSMLGGREMTTWDGLPVRSWSTRRADDVLVSDQARLVIAKLAEGHHIFFDRDNQNFYDNKDPFALDVNPVPDKRGIAIDLFPATTVYLTATVVDPAAPHFDPALGRIVTGPVESKLFYQFKGLRADLNHNGIDDAVDIYRGTSKDVNHNGVPDEVDPAFAPRCGGVSISPRSSTLALGAVGLPYSRAFTASGGTPPYRFRIAYPITTPPGLTMSSAGVLSGTPTLPGRFNFGVVATDAAGAFTCSSVYSLTVAP